MNRLLTGSFVLCLAALFVGCGANDAEVAKHEPLAKDLVRLSTELADSLEKLQKEAGANPANALQFAENLKNAEKVQTVAAQLQTKAAEYEKLPNNVQKSLEAKYGAPLRDSVRRAGEATKTK